MKRRDFGVLAGGGVAGASMLAMNMPQARAADASLLKTTLTPFGAERAGNADGSIPAWTGGYQTIPAGWTPKHYMPSPYDGDAMVVEINAQNMAQYADKLSVGTQAMMTKYGFSIKVYPTHRSHSLPPDVYDYIAANVTNARASDDGGIKWGIVGAYGGVPFPIPDPSDPEAADKILWNNALRFQGRGFRELAKNYVMSQGHLELASMGDTRLDAPYYKKGGSFATYNGMYFRLASLTTAPANLVGAQVVSHDYTDSKRNLSTTWELLAGQGRVRRAPEIGYDTPSQYTDGVSNYDEYYGFGSELDRYDATIVGKKELYIPYNNNQMTAATAQELHGPHSLNPDIIRWELHRVWVVDVKLAPGQRNVMAKRRFYIDEDTWIIGAVETYDGNLDLYHVGFTYNMVRPDLPATVLAANTVHNLQTGDYASVSILTEEKTNPSLYYVDGWPDYTFDPARMAAQASY